MTTISDTSTTGGWGHEGGYRTTRRAVLAATGTATLAGLAGCADLGGLLDRASEQAVATRTASPAGFYTGDVEGDTTYTSGPVDVRFVPPSLRAQDRRIDVDGWSTTTTTRAQDYNSSRSNKPSTIWVPNPDVDGDGVDDLIEVLDIERARLVYADAAIEAVDNRSSDDATATLDAFINATTKARGVLDRCGTETCKRVRANAAEQRGLAEDARDAVAAGEWEGARRSVQQARRGVQGDVDDIWQDLDSDADGLPDLTASLYGYLDGRPTIGEHFVVSVPDAQVRGDGPSLDAELTPRRVLDYFTGERDAEGCAESDRAVAVHRDLSCRDLLSATLSAPPVARRGIDKKDIRRGVAAFETDGGVVVTGATPDAAIADPMLRIAPDNAVSSVEALDSWGPEASAGEATVSSVLVCPVDATPDDCPCPMPALFHVRRIRHEDQLLFAGGWLIDDGALYDDSATLLAADGPPIVAGITRADIEAGGVDLESRGRIRKKPGRTTYGNITLSRGYDPEDDHLPAGAKAVCPADGSVYCWGVQSREGLARHDTGDCDDTDDDVRPKTAVSTALDAPVLHLAEAAEASNDVKFKAGAELSKAVN